LAGRRCREIDRPQPQRGGAPRQSERSPTQVWPGPGAWEWRNRYTFLARFRWGSSVAVRTVNTAPGHAVVGHGRAGSAQNLVQWPGTGWRTPPAVFALVTPVAVAPRPGSAVGVDWPR